MTSLPKAALLTPLLPGAISAAARAPRERRGQTLRGPRPQPRPHDTRRQLSPPGLSTTAPLDLHHSLPGEHQVPSSCSAASAGAARRAPGTDPALICKGGAARHPQPRAKGSSSEGTVPAPVSGEALTQTGTGRDPQPQGPAVASTGRLASRRTSPPAAVRYKPHITFSRTSGATRPVDAGCLRTPGPQHRVGLLLLGTARWELPPPHRSGGRSRESSAWSELLNKAIAAPQSHRLLGALRDLPEKQPRGFGCSHPSRRDLGLDGSVLAPPRSAGPRGITRAQPALEGVASPAWELLEDTQAESAGATKSRPHQGSSEGLRKTQSPKFSFPQMNLGFEASEDP